MKQQRTQEAPKLDKINTPKINEPFYQMYKAGRDMVEACRHKDLSEPFQEFVDGIESGSKSLDKRDPKYYERWKKERNAAEE